MLENLCVDSKLGLQPGVFRLDVFFLTYRPLLSYHFVASLGLFQPLLIYRHCSVVRMLLVPAAVTNTIRYIDEVM